MTTIATDGKLLAADGRTSAGDVILTNAAKKVQRLPDGSIAGSAGAADGGPSAVAALAAALKAGEQPPKYAGDYSILRLLPDGSALYYYDRLDMPIPVSPPFAIGSGKSAALGAMKAGANARQAVKIAAEVDVYTGGKITSYSR